MKKIILYGLFSLFSGLINAQKNKEIYVSTVHEIQNKLNQLKPGDILVLNDGNYKDIKLIVHNSGTKSNPITIKAKNRLKVDFIGDVKVELRGEHIILDGIYFKNGNRNPKEWKTHGPGLVAIYASYNRVTQCAFHAFDQANSAYITTSLTKEGKVPQYCRIDHCSFTEKITFDQVINLNNVTPEDKKKPSVVGIPMYHRIDHCYFSNPKKPGNAGGGIRVGYWRSDYGRCLIDNNVFERQDSEAEIITSKSMENVYYNNTIKNCRGTLNFRHGDKQIAINNFFIGNDEKYEYGGMFVWGSHHIIACNYYQLPTTLGSRGNAALYLNSGAVASEHALFFNSSIINNVFVNNNGYAINFEALAERRKIYCKQKNLKFEQPRDIYLAGNVFVNKKHRDYTFFNIKGIIMNKRNIKWNNNVAFGQDSEITYTKIDGVDIVELNLKGKTDYFNLQSEISNYKLSQFKKELFDIEGIDLDIEKLVNEGIKGKPLSWEDVGPDDLDEIPGTYAKTGKLSLEIQEKFKEVINKRLSTNKKKK
ncbi:chondroitinase-B domain-containing protein [Tamlana sp. 2201CG12-4]|uniref:chondroitinase-B domain-containing protein n=1 Tax=Tamlana sp. 2201CG12-4 TaxID=3112582 RepID=UPI002DB5AFB3|nr:chondroitinase-B domain-containing protein [Tamlana sp. 2201CG12-4]MEC3908811.1 chondroitinase-B domain-containing protein [Tamlana sp. 2201CG12-4]